MKKRALSLYEKNHTTKLEEFAMLQKQKEDITTVVNDFKITIASIDGEIKTIQAVNAYNILTNFKATDLSDDTLMALWNDLKLMRPITDEYNKSVEEVKKSLQDDTYNTMVERVRIAQEREQKVKDGTYTLTEDDIKDTKEINEYFANFNTKGEEYINKLSDAEIDIDIKKISKEDFLKFMKTSDNNWNAMLKLDFLTD